MIASSGKSMQFLEIGVAQHQPIVGVPQHEGFRDRFDGVTQAHVGGDRPLHQALLLGDVDGDADEMQAGLARLAHQFATRAQPDPMAVGVAHAEGMVDRGRLCFRKFGGEVVELHVLGMHQCIHIAEGQQVILGLKPKDVEHRLRPEDAAASEIPIPKAAAATVQRRIDAAADRFVDNVGFPRACRLPMEGKSEDQHDEAGGGGEGDCQRRQRTPCRERGASLSCTTAI